MIKYIIIIKEDFSTMAKQTLQTRPQKGLSKQADRRLTQAEFQGLAQVPPEMEWFINIENPRTKRAYRNDLKDFREFVGIERPEEYRVVTRAHVIAWRDDLKRRKLSPATIRRKLSALTSIFDYLCDKNAITHKSSN